MHVVIPGLLPIPSLRISCSNPFHMLFFMSCRTSLVKCCSTVPGALATLRQGKGQERMPCTALELHCDCIVTHLRSSISSKVCPLMAQGLPCECPANRSLKHALHGLQLERSYVDMHGVMWVKLRLGPCLWQQNAGCKRNKTNLAMHSESTVII